MHSVTFSMDRMQKTQLRLHPAAYLCPTSKLEAAGVRGSAVGPLSGPLRRADCDPPHPPSGLCYVLRQEVVQYCGFVSYFIFFSDTTPAPENTGLCFFFLQTLVNFDVSNRI